MMTIKLFETNDAAKCDDDERMRRRRKCGRDRPPSFDAFVKREREFKERSFVLNVLRENKTTREGKIRIEFNCCTKQKTFCDIRAHIREPHTKER